MPTSYIRSLVKQSNNLEIVSSLSIDRLKSPVFKNIRIMERKQSSGFRRIFTVAFDRLF